MQQKDNALTVIMRVLILGRNVMPALALGLVGQLTIGAEASATFGSSTVVDSQEFLYDFLISSWAISDMYSRRIICCLYKALSRLGVIACYSKKWDFFFLSYQHSIVICIVIWIKTPLYELIQAQHAIHQNLIYILRVFFLHLFRL